MEHKLDPEQLARRFHAHYERLAPEFGHATRLDTRKPWDQLPTWNRRLMIAAVTAALKEEEVKP